MPLCTLHLVSLNPSTPLSTFLPTLQSSPTPPLLISRVIRWIILPAHLSTAHLLAQNIKWDLLVLMPNTGPLPDGALALIHHHWRITAGVPGRLINGFAAKNEKLLRPDPGHVPPLPPTSAGEGLAESSQGLELSRELDGWITRFQKSGSDEAHGAVSMFNLLAFLPGKKGEYLEYGKAFGETVGRKFGGDAKIVGGVVGGDTDDKDEWDAANDGWDEIAIAHYPSIAHFRAMLRDEAYQEVNRRCRVGSLRDTAILMTSEVGVGGGRVGAKL